MIILNFIIIIIFINYFHLCYHPSSILSPQPSFTPISVRVGVRLGLREGRWAAGWSGGRGRRGGRGGEAPRAGFTLLVRIIRPAGREELTVYRLGLPLFVFI